MKAFNKWLIRGEDSLTGFLMLAGIIVLFINICLRYFFHDSSSWVEEALRYSIIWVTFVGGSQCARTGNHVGVDLLIQVMPKKVQKYFFALAQFIAAAFCCVATYASFQAMALVIKTHQKSPAMLMPMWIIYLSLPIGFALMTIRFIIAGAKDLENKSSGGAVTDENGNVDMSRL